MRAMPANTIAGMFGLAGFTVAVIAGLAVGNPTTSVLWRSILAMIVCYPVGLAIGLVAQKVIQDHIRAHKSANPAQDSTLDDEPVVPRPAKEGDDDILIV